MGKTFKIAESRSLQVRFDATSILNHPLPVAPDLSINSDTPFGYISAKGTQHHASSARILSIEEEVRGNEASNHCSNRHALFLSSAVPLGIERRPRVYQTPQDVHCELAQFADTCIAPLHRACRIGLRIQWIRTERTAFRYREPTGWRQKCLS